MERIRKFIPLVVIIILLVIGGFFYYQYHKAKLQLQSLQSNPALLTQNQSAQTITQVGKLMELPANETPTIATVTDVSKLLSQPFFQDAKNGDKVLIYTKSQKAILYDPIANKIVDVAPVNIGSSSTQIASVKVDIQNGTKTVGLTNKIETEIKKANPDLDIIGHENASKQNYTSTLVIPLTNAGEGAVSSLKATLNASQSALPSGEKADDSSDILIIAGSDQI